MLKNAIGYVVGIAILGSLLAVGISMVLSVLPYVSAAIIMLVPFYGVVRRHKNWTHEYLGMKTFVKAFMKVFKFGKPSLTFYLILGIAIGFTYGQIIPMLFKAGIFVIGGVVATYIAWETMRFVLNKWKNVQVLSFKEAMKSSW